jgi:hypothetical protein
LRAGAACFSGAISQSALLRALQRGEFHRKGIEAAPALEAAARDDSEKRVFLYYIANNLKKDSKWLTITKFVNARKDPRRKRGREGNTGYIEQRI